MQFVRTDEAVRREFIALNNTDDVIQLYKETYGESNLPFYSEPPTTEISLRDFETFACERLKVLKKIEELKAKYARNPEDIFGAMLKELSKLMPIACRKTPSEKLHDDRKKDYISHFILRLAFCRTPEQTKWFIQQEVELFKFRFNFELKNSSDISQFLSTNKFNIERVTEEELKSLSSILSNAVALPTQKVMTSQFWKVPCLNALDLVRRRKVYLRNGFTYVSQQDLVVIVCTKLRLIISSAMARACKFIGFIEEANRLLPILQNMINQTCFNRDCEKLLATSRTVTPYSLDELSTRSFPLCMRQIHNRLRASHHVRHGARMQYGLFLKGIGMSMEDSLLFWRSEFTKTMDSERFDKQYAYNIRHNYGKEGSRVNYSAYPCSRIILGAAPSATDCHGCPYRHHDPAALSRTLKDVGLSSERVNQILEMAKLSQYDRACTRFFESTHELNDDSLQLLISHPNQYFELSQQMLKPVKNDTEIVVERNFGSTSTSQIKE